jgi:DNA-binding NarL/FixJ family response regulator
VVGLAPDGLAAVRLCAEQDPDVVVMDVRMPHLDGIEATRRIVAASADSRPRMLMLTTFDLDEHVYDALDAGASGFLLKDVTAEQLFDAVRIVAAGDGLIAPGITRRLIAEFARRRPPEPARLASLDALTPRETEVLRLIAEGLAQRRDRRPAGHRRADGQDPRQPHPHQARPAGPRAGRGRGLRVRPGRRPPAGVVEMCSGGADRQESV